MAGEKKDEDKAAPGRAEDSYDHAGRCKPVSVEDPAESILKNLGQMQCTLYLPQSFDTGYHISRERGMAQMLREQVE